MKTFVDMAKGFVDSGFEFLVVGACALAAHGFPRTTGDIDLFVRPSPENAEPALRALAEFGRPSHDSTSSKKMNTINGVLLWNFKRVGGCRGPMIALLKMWHRN